MSSTVLPPKHAQILVIGGGPGGSYASASLAREGFDVVLFEAAVFPRYHIGESLIPSVRHHLRFVDAEKKIIEHNFNRKPGAAWKLNQFKQEGYTNFVGVGFDNGSWNVTRSEFDKILLDHSESEGVKVFQSTRVTSLDFSGERPISAHYTHGPSSQSGTITFDYVIDASGRAGLIANRYLKNRQYNSSLKNVASWAYWRDAGVYGVGTTAEGAPYFEALTDESGWAWFIPLKEGVISVGIVRHQDAFNEAVRTHTNDSASDGSAASGTEQRYLKALDLAPNLKQLMGPKAKMQRGNPDSETVRTASDYSYSATSYAGERFRLVGDAAAFIDPLFSSGVHLAMTGGIAAAASIAASIRGNCSEAEAVAWHTERVNISYTRFLVVVLGTYKQIRSQSENVLSDVGENNFDKAFNFLRPVIQGSADFGPRLTEDEVQNALDFCSDILVPVNDDIENAVYKHLQSQSGNAYLGAKVTTQNSEGPTAAALLDPKVPPLAQKDVKEIAKKISSSGEIGSGENLAEETRLVLGRINSRRIIHREYSGLHSLEEETFAGYRVRLERGKLGLVAGASA